MDNVLSLVKRHDEWRLGRCINLQCSENVTSEAVRKILSSDMGHRYTLPIETDVHGSFVENAYRGTRFMDEIEAHGEEVASRLFGGKYATLKPLSGHIAGMIMLLAACERGDRILVIDATHGGYDGYIPGGMPSMFGLEAGFLPFIERNWNVDSEAAAEKIRSYKPRLVILGASFILFPYDIKPMREAADEVEALIGYDGSHVLGLVAGGVFQRPLQEGADILTGSTHKSFFGPQGGIVVCRDADLFKRVEKSFFWRVMDNAHWNRIAALARSLKEAERYSASYAKQVVKNSKTLATELNGWGLAIKCRELGYTECHQIHIDESDLKSRWGFSFNDFAMKLEKSNIIVDAVGRLGTNELTRLGCREKEMKAVAGMVERAMKGEGMAAKAKSFRSKLKMKYC